MKEKRRGEKKVLATICGHYDYSNKRVATHCGKMEVGELLMIVHKLIFNTHHSAVKFTVQIQY